MRGGAGPYWYQKVRQGGRVTSRYWGRGELAAAVAGMADLDARERDARREHDLQAMAAAASATSAPAAAMAALDALADAAIEAELAARGLHRRRGEWRRRRGA